MRFNVVLLTVLGSVLLSGCSDRRQPTVTPAKVAKVPQVHPDSRAQIELTDIEGGAVSTTRNFYFVFDGSGSMSKKPENDSKFKTKIEGAKWAVREFAKHLPADANIGLYVFDSSGSREVVSLRSEGKAAFLQAIDRVRAGGGTPLQMSIHTGVDALVAQYKKQLGYGEYRLVIVTDGLADHLNEAASYATQYGIPMYTIGLDVGENHPLRQLSVSYRAADTMEDLRDALKDTLAESEVFDASSFEEAAH
jgi:Ca-activated chloride channel homolog